MKQINVISISGGKDSTAMWLLALERGTPNLKVVFSDVGHEHPETYKYIDYLEKELGPITRIKPDFSQQIMRKREVVDTKWRKEGVSETIIQQALEVLHPTGNPFLDLCMWKGRFPSTMARFCTVELKVRPMFDQIYIPIFEAGNKVISWQGIRANESLSRSKMDEIARRFPEEVERVARWEEIVSKASKRGSTTFFTSDDRGHGINDVVEWSKTTYGGVQYDLLKLMEEVPVCSSQYGLCE